jgi:hypothetical protein
VRCRRHKSNQGQQARQQSLASVVCRYLCEDYQPGRTGEGARMTHRSGKKDTRQGQVPAS